MTGATVEVDPTVVAGAGVVTGARVVVTGALRGISGPENPTASSVSGPAISTRTETLLTGAADGLADARLAIPSRNALVDMPAATIRPA
jgi:hypothetical protein